MANGGLTHEHRELARRTAVERQVRHDERRDPDKQIARRCALASQACTGITELLGQYGWHNDSHGACKHYVGILGDITACVCFRCSPDLQFRPGGDGGIDLFLPITSPSGRVWDYPADVKVSTFRDADPHLRCPINQFHEKINDLSVIYIAGSYDSRSDDVELKGWQRGPDLISSTPRTYGPYRTFNYWCRYNELRPISDLLSLIRPSN
jgi:hypothetical protein